MEQATLRTIMHASRRLATSQVTVFEDLYDHYRWYSFYGMSRSAFAQPCLEADRAKGATRCSLTMLRRQMPRRRATMMRWSF